MIMNSNYKYYHGHYMEEDFAQIEIHRE
jgi:hypothetical protein